MFNFGKFKNLTFFVKLKNCEFFRTVFRLKKVQINRHCMIENSDFDKIRICKNYF